MTSHPCAAGAPAACPSHEIPVPASSLAVPFEAVVIGAGFGGICMGRALLKAGIGHFVILERAQDIGGVWRDNDYPGAACDVPSHLYSFSFAPNPDWPRRFAAQPDILAYLRALQTTGATSVEVEPGVHRDFDKGLQARLQHTVWQGCRSWYLDRHGRNSANWPGFSFHYRWLARRSSLAAYRFSAPMPDHPGGLHIAAPPVPGERLQAGFQRAFLRVCFRPLIGPPFGAGFQRTVVKLLAPLMPGVRGVRLRQERMQGVPVEIVTPEQTGKGAILYLHGGAFCLGSPVTHRSITTRLAREARMDVWVPDYRLAPEHRYPAALDDAQACYQAMLASGIPAAGIVFGGDSAGASLALALVLRLRDAGQPLPAGLALASPVSDPGLSGASVAARAGIDPMVRKSWVAQGIAWYACPAQDGVHAPLTADLRGLPPMLIQVGDQEILHDDATLLTAHARECGVSCVLEEYAQRWHVFHLQAFYLRSAAHAIGRLAGFARACIAPVTPASETAASADTTAAGARHDAAAS